MENEKLPKLPIGVQDFEELRMGGYVMQFELDGTAKSAMKLIDDKLSKNLKPHAEKKTICIGAGIATKTCHIKNGRAKNYEKEKSQKQINRNTTKKTMKNFLTSLAAVLIGGIILLLAPIFIMIVIAASSVGDTPESAEPNSVMILDLSQEMADREIDGTSYRVRKMLGGEELATGLNVVIDNLYAAADDDNIIALMICGSESGADHAQLTELRQAVIDFKEQSGKPVIYYDTNTTGEALYIGSVADSVYLAPQGMAMVKGVTMTKNYYTKAAEKLGVGFDVIKHGKYKSAVEPFFRGGMSESDREQSQRIVDVLWSEQRDSIATRRGIAPASIDSYVDNLEYTLASNAEKVGLIDRLAYRDEVEESIKAMTGKDSGTELKFKRIEEYEGNEGIDVATSSKQVAVVYASGEIYDGSSKTDKMNIYGDDLTATLRKLRSDKEVKAVVLRVNSPGGSALASDLIWREVMLLKKTKPVIVSMSGYAASGGYYISCAANRIVAEPTTMTGSIGVFGLIPNIEKLRENIGVGFSMVSSNKNQPALGSLSLTAEQIDAITRSV